MLTHRIGVVCSAVVGCEEEQIIALAHLLVERVEELLHVAVERQEHFLILLARREPCASLM